MIRESAKLGIWHCPRTPLTAREILTLTLTSLRSGLISIILGWLSNGVEILESNPESLVDKFFKRFEAIIFRLLFRNLFRIFSTQNSCPQKLQTEEVCEQGKRPIVQHQRGDEDQVLGHGFGWGIQLRKPVARARPRGRKKEAKTHQKTAFRWAKLVCRVPTVHFWKRTIPKSYLTLTVNHTVRRLFCTVRLRLMSSKPETNKQYKTFPVQTFSLTNYDFSTKFS